MIKSNILTLLFFIAFAGSNALKEIVKPELQSITVIQSPEKNKKDIGNHEIDILVLENNMKGTSTSSNDDIAPFLMKRGKGKGWKHGGRWKGGWRGRGGWGRKPWKYGPGGKYGPNGPYGGGGGWGRKPWKYGPGGKYGPNGKYGPFGRGGYYGRGGGPGGYNRQGDWD